MVRTLEHAFETRRGAAAPEAPAPQPPATPATDATAAMTISVTMDAAPRVLRGEPVEVVAAAVGAPAEAVAAWRAEFLAGAAARLAGA